MRVCPRCGARYTGEARFCSHDGEATQELLPSDSGDPLLGTVVDGRYRVEAVIGEGGMGVVYGVTHVTLGKRFALKVLRRDYARDETVVERFVREAQAATSIGHESIVDIHDFGRLPDASTYFVMELLEGETLTARIRRGPLEPEEMLRTTRQIASALSAAHASGIVHRDLKPDNVHLVPRGNDPPTVKVLDFGIAKVGGAHGKLTRTGTVFGTPYYMSPEQAAGQSVDGRTDVYALGVLVYEMLTGQVPFDGDTFMGILSKQMFEAPPSLVASGIDPGLAEAVSRALAKRPEERTPTMEALVDDLEAAMAGESLVPRGGPGSRPAPAATSPAAPERRRTGLLLSGAALALFGTFAGGLALYVRGQEPRPVAPRTPATSARRVLPKPPPRA
ncbi:MAG: serine/threonine-protein kinase, partial [Myxococcota bacterium]